MGRRAGCNLFSWAAQLNRRQLVHAGALTTLGGLTACSQTVLHLVKEQEVSRIARGAAQPVALNRIAFGSCIDQNKPQPLWGQILADKPDLFIFGGDNVYASKQPFDITNTHAAYAALAANEGFAKLRATVPHLAIWDDHDYGLNDGGAAFPHKQATKDVFLNFWNIPADDARRSREGLYHSVSYGPSGERVQIILLDNRWFLSKWKPTDQRDAPGKERYVPDADPSKTILGEAQWAWLEAQLKQPADVRILVSGIQTLATGHGWESWSLFPAERQKLFDTIARTRANGVVMLSGDRHIGAIYKETLGTPYPLFEMTSSGMTHPWKDAKEAGPNRVGELFTELHYGMVELDWAARAVKLQLRDAAGKVQREQIVSIADLKN
jgi:alkaline phosphatase D